MTRSAGDSYDACPDPIRASSMASTSIRSLRTRLLHFALLSAVLWQLTASGLVERPRVGRPGNLF